MVLIPQETLTKLQSARRLEQTPTTRVVHGIDTDMRQLLERQDLTDDQKIKLYHQTLQRYIELNKQRMAPLTMTLQTENDKTDDQPPQLKLELPQPARVPPKLKREKMFKTPTKLKVSLSEWPDEEEYGLPRLFAEASHLDTHSVKKKRTSKTTPTLSKQKWTPY